MKTIVGIDEAGRGPVIGPMVMAGVKIPEEKEQNLINIGVKDSKLLSVIQRERMYDQIKDIAGEGNYCIIVVSPKEIDEILESEDSNLNWLEADTSAKVINELKGNKAFVDCPSNNIEKYSEYLRSKLEVETELVVEHKADFTYPVCSAASILAKVTRDREIEKIKSKLNENFGSGYPSDPLTQKFLKANYKKHEDVFRKSWASYKKVAATKNQSNLMDY